MYFVESKAGPNEGIGGVERAAGEQDQGEGWHSKGCQNLPRTGLANKNFKNVNENYIFTTILYCKVKE